MLAFLSISTNPLLAQCPCDGSTITIHRNFSGNLLLSQFVPATKQVWQNENICIQGTLNIDVPLTLQQCTLFMAANSKIILSNGVNLQAISNTLFRGCTDMWQGIVVSAGTSVSFDQTRVQNAITGIQLATGYKGKSCSITNSGFFNNKAGISVMGFNTFLFPFTGNTFSTDSPNLLPPIQNETAYSGLHFENVSSAILTVASDNHFSNVQRGIESIFSTVDVFDGSFSNFTTIATDAFSGHGIVSVGNFLTVSNCDFTSGRGGIFSAYDAKLKVSACNFSSVINSGVEALLPFSVLIHSNTFNMDQTTEVAAIHMIRPPILSNGFNWITENLITTL